MNLLELFTNTHGLLYEGDLIPYFVPILTAPNKNNPYHNVSHLLHVFTQCYNGAQTLGLPPRDTRLLLIAALFHDYDHSGTHTTSDSFNIERALSGLNNHITKQDRPSINTIASLIKITQYPSIGEAQSTAEQIIRDADISSVFHEDWITTTVYGLAQEKGIDVSTMLVENLAFLHHIHFYTSWAQEKYLPLCPGRVRELETMITLFDSSV